MEPLTFPTFGQLADSWRLWAAVGSAICLRTLLPTVWALIVGQAKGTTVDQTIAPQPRRLAALLSGCFIAVGFVIAGFFIPMASDGRLSWLDEVAVANSPVVSVSWLLWGIGIWLLALSYSPRWKYTVGASIVLWLCALLGSIETAGAML